MSVSGHFCILFMSNVGCCVGFVFRERIIDNVLSVLKETCNKSVQVFILFRSMFSECAVPIGDSTMMYKLVSLANQGIEQPRFLTMSFI